MQHYKEWGGGVATSAWLPDQSVNNKAWLILQKLHFQTPQRGASHGSQCGDKVNSSGTDLLSQFPCNKVEGCDLNFLISAPTPPPTYLSPYCILRLVALLPNMLLHYLIAPHLFPISGGVVVPKTNNSYVVFLQLLMFLCFFFFFFSFICHWCGSVVRTANSSAGSQLRRLSLFSFCFLRLSLRWNMIVVIPVSDCSTETQTFNAIRPRSWDGQRAVV